MGVWVVFTIMAVVMQSVRSAAQKNLSTHLSALSVTYVRYMYGLPIGLIYIVVLFFVFDIQMDQIILAIKQFKFWLFVLIASVAQILATAFVVRLFSYRNFSVAIAFSKTEAMFAGLFAAVFFQDFLSQLGWVAVCLGLMGIVMLSKINFKELSSMPKQALFYGLGSGLLFAFTSLSLREASLILNLPLLLSASMTLLFMLILQSIICFVIIKKTQKEQLIKIKSHRKVVWFIGVTSALGSIGWFSAMSLLQVAIVKTLGQLEVVFMLLLSLFYFKEKISLQEFSGIVLISLSVVFVFI
ncbi:MAG: DMT family transporter [Saccharospirillaceae bacterium]|nr:DMT family transporter [Pseudomonadales bacterium]NRB80566.1 DMT family transporter [Saccharospirillaceae bacterium]